MGLRAPSTWGGAWRGKVRGVGGRHDTRSQVPLRRLPLSRRGHQPRRLALLPLSPEPAHGRRDAGRAWHRCEPRDRAAVGPQVRPGFRQPDPAPAALSWRQVALDEVCLMIAGQKHWLWRAVDQDGVVLDVLVQRRRDKKAAKRLLRKLLKRQARVPRVMITDKLPSYGAAKGEVMPSVEHRRHKGLNNR